MRLRATLGWPLILSVSLKLRMSDLYFRSVRITLVWGFIPTIVFYLPFLTNNIIGVCLGPVVLVHKTHSEDFSTLAHELEHCKQFWARGLVIHFLRYSFSKNYRLRSEVEAYAAELIYSEKHLDEDAISIAGQTIAQAYRLHACPEVIKQKMHQELEKRLRLSEQG